MNEEQLYGKLSELREKYREKYDAYPSKKLADGTEAKEIPANDIENLRALQAEIDDIGAKYDEARKFRQIREDINAAEEAKNNPANRLTHSTKSDPNLEAKGVGEFLTESKEFQDKNPNGFKDVAIPVDWKSFLGLEQKATVSTSSGFEPFVLRDGGVVSAILRPPQLIDIIRFEPTTQNSIKYMKQTTASSAAASKAEGVALAEATMVWTEQTGSIEKIGAYVPVTEEQLEDATEVRSLIETELRRDVRLELDRQVTVGDGTGNDLLGLYNATNVQAQAKGTNEPVFDAVLKAMTNVNGPNGRARVNFVSLTATDHQNMCLQRTSDGMYIMGNPSETPLTRVWGVSIVISDALTTGTGLVGDTDYCRGKLRKDIVIAASDSHGEYFIQNMLAIRAHCRAGLKIMRDEAFCRLTAL